MGIGYTRQSAADIVDGELIVAAPLNTEFNQLESAFNGTTGHSHDGTVGEGPKLDFAVSITGNTDLLAIEALAGTSGGLFKTAANTWALRTLTAPAAGISVTNGDGVSGNPTLALANDLAALEGLASTGIAVRSTTDTWVQRTITGTANQVTVTNGDGVSGNPTLSVPSTFILPGTLDVTGATILPVTSDGTALGSGTKMFSDLFLALGGVLNFNNGDWVATHTAGVLTVGTGDLRVSTAGTNNASVVTVGGTQTLTGKTMSGASNTFTNIPISSAISGLGTGVGTALGVNVDSAGAVVVNGGALGTPSSGTLTNATGLPISTGVSGLATGVATFLATPSSANLRAALTDETGTGVAVFADQPSFVTNITISGNSGSTAANLSKSASGQFNAIRGRTNGSDRWLMMMGNTTSESGTNAGSDWELYRYDDSGVFLGTPLAVTRSSGLITLGSGQLQFPATQNPSSNANTLDDYEEGTTAISQGSGVTASSGTLNAASGNRHYTKIGRQVTVNWKLTITDIGTTVTASGLVMTLPFTSSSTAGSAAGTFGLVSSLFGVGFIDNSATTVNFRQVSGTLGNNTYYFSLTYFTD